jgi:hypothetical protein
VDAEPASKVGSLLSPCPSGGSARRAVLVLVDNGVIFILANPHAGTNTGGRGGRANSFSKLLVDFMFVNSETNE